MRRAIWLAAVGGWLVGCAPSVRCYSDLECKSSEACDTISHTCKDRSKFDFGGVPQDLGTTPADLTPVDLNVGEDLRGGDLAVGDLGGDLPRADLGDLRGGGG